MHCRSRNSRKRSSRRSSRACASSCCARSEQEQNLCNYCTRESRNSKCSCCCRRLKSKPSNECNLKCQEKNTGVKPLNVHLKLQLLNDHNQDKKSECLCAKYFQMLNACYGGPPLCQNLCAQGEDKQMCEKPCFLKSMKKRCNFFRKSNHNIEETSPCRFSSQQQRHSKIENPVQHVDGETQTDEKRTSTHEDYIQNILSPDNNNRSTQNVTCRKHSATMYKINSTLNDISSTLEGIEIKLKNSEPKSTEIDNFNSSTRKSSVSPTIVSYFTKCVPPPPLLTLSKLSCYYNPSPTIPIFPTQKSPKTDMSCEEILKLFNYNKRNSFNYNVNPCTQNPNCNAMKGDNYTNETMFHANNDHNIL